MASYTLAQVRTRVRERTDTVGSDFVTDTELNGLINTAYAELYGMLTTKSLHRAETVYEVTANGSSEYGLPSDFFGLIGVYRTIGDDKVPLERFPEKFRPGSRTGDAVSYRVVGTDLVLYPKPSSGTYDVVYIPTPGTLSADDDTLDGVLGWEEFVVIEAAINVLAKEESDTTALEIKRERILRRIRDEAEAAEFTETPRILNVRDGWRQITDPAEWWPASGDDWDV